MNLSVSPSRIGEVEVIALSGELDLATLPRAHDALSRAGRSDAPTIAVDLDGVTLVDDSTLGALVGSLAALSTDHRSGVVVATHPDLVRRLGALGVPGRIALASSVHDVVSRDPDRPARP